MSMLIPLLKLEPFCPMPTAMVPCSLSHTIAETYHTQCPKWNYHIFHTPILIVQFLQVLQCRVEMVLLRPLCCELSRFCCHGYSLLLLSWRSRIVIKTLPAASVDIYRISIISILTVPPQSLYANLALAPASSLHFLFSTFRPDLEVWLDCWDYAEFLHSPIQHPSRKSP